ncbi:MAG: hypothetical protein OJF59_001591 [Cytophagales bacterium]|jgi:phosphopantetheinyl transferase|nr:4'-phosphopantetheinyl transferase superfamily protein [Bacteroidota bacterium]MBS1980520.1 4'-phosphopantetheinyl transferase superfamily protein [Bacteroidota bacterium]WHZ07838.1 MAG: hypothetical protein OJF59_001591 [Cytophagales bacterium]
MPLNSFYQNEHQSGWATWRITETEEQLTSPVIGSPPPEITNERKRLEWLAGRHIAMTLCNHLGLRYFGIRKNELGKPFLEKYAHHISLSHSFPYVAVQIDRECAVGVDLEQPREKLLAVAPRILSSSELVNAGKDITKLCVYWCAKEAMFKIQGKGGLYFSKHLKVEPFELSETGSLAGTIVDETKRLPVNLNYQVSKEYVLVTGKQIGS